MKQKLGHYEIVAELGRGGMGVVYKGYEPALSRHVAIKVLADALAHDPNVVERFLREARSMAQLNDPHIIQIFFIGQDEGTPYFVMEFVDGESLSNVLRREGRLSPAQAANVIFQTAQGLATAHDKGVVHRDIKPGNLMITMRGNVKIADFGIALSTMDLSKKLTSTGEFVGTPGYLSPEVCLGKPVDQRSDIFSLGIVLFEMLTGKMPFTDESPLGLMLEVVRAEIPDVRQLNADVDAGLHQILARMIAKDPAQRYQNCHELAHDLQGHPLLARPTPLTIKRAAPPSAATVVGSTPAPVGAPPTPPPASVNALPGTARAQAAPAAAANDEAPTHAAAPRRPSVMEQQSARSPSPSRSAWPLVAGLVLVIGGAGAAGYTFRDRIPFLNGGNTTSAPVTLASTPSGTVAANTTAAQSGTSTTAPVSTTSTATTANGGTGDASTPAGTFTTERTAASGTETSTRIAQTDVETGDGRVETSVSEGTEASAQPSGGFTSAETSETTASTDEGWVMRDRAGLPPALKRLSEERPQVVERLAERASGSNAGSEPRIVARRTDPKTVEQRTAPREPSVVVVSIGDPAITTHAEHLVEEALIEDGFRLIDESMLTGVARHLGAQNPDMAALFAALRSGADIDVVVVVRAQYLGQQELVYYGQSSTLHSVNLQVRPYLVSEKRPLSAGWSTKVDFTTLNAQEKATEAVDPELDQLLSVLGPYRPRGKA